ncbi:transglycosylase domain-containing protein [Secundilactobacillus paracollinoides]|uniref:Carboxypeptidase n=1 Tax=Secundilactobacillus paracollinoides TaxID=240427 RepID=A0A1B2J1B2_9LACO|nr:transglycosylase domain-containing protein [Secundilactobacillus paracollinoides]ANZ62092.1 carboxypeptidase [Secundilactobacillus paracollinoides]ANZ68040.1 carboxypeptidase [Secundilactobacillus paracollinoides]
MSSNSNNDETRSGRRQQNAKPKRKRHLFRTIFTSLLVLFLGAILLGAGLFFYYAQGAPNITESELSSDTSTKVYDADNNVISRLGAQNRDYVKSSKIPGTLKQAVVSIEDRRFYKEHGVDPIRIVEVAFSNIRGSSLGMQGGSTLTQQLVKLSVFSTSNADRTLKRKAQEAWLAIKVDQKYSKSKILEFYINKVYMGNGVYGMETAAKYYYGKSLSRLTLPQLAMLAGMPQSPTNYDPTRYPKYATYRRNQVLAAMAQNKVISSAQAKAAEATSVQSGLAKTHPVTTVTNKNQKYIDAYLKQVYAELKADGYNTSTDGLRVYTNLDMSAQKHLYNIVNSNNYVAFPSKKFQVGATLINPNNGKVTAMIGGRKTGNVSFGLNRAVQTDRSSGSTIKPLMDYGPAIQYLKYPTYEPVKDTAYTYPGTDKQLNDFDDKYEGTITMRKALVESRNIPAIRTLDAVGITKATKFLSGLGMTFKDKLTLQNGIGAYISTEQEAAGYSAFANGGTYYKPSLLNKVVTKDGKSHSYGSTGKRAMSSATAFMITNMLKGVINSSNGSGTAAAISGLYQAGKTGTTAYPDDYVNKVPASSTMDSWFTGYTKNYSLSVWTGYDKQFATGGYVTEDETKIAQEIYKYEMTYLAQNENVSNTDWTKPNDVVETTRNGVDEYYIQGYPGDTTTSANGGTSTNAYSSSASSATGTSSSNAATTNRSTSSSTSSTDSTSSSTSTKQEPSGGSGSGSGNDGNSTETTTSSSTSTTTSESTGGSTTTGGTTSTKSSAKASS